MHTAPSFSMPNFPLAPYTLGGNGRASVQASGNYQATYTIVAYTDPIPIPDSLLCFLPNHAYQNPSCFNAYEQLEAGDFGYETPLQSPFSPQSIDVMLARSTVKPNMDPNNLTNQLTTIMCESFGIEPSLRMRLPKTIP
jgi:hypothetical protein